jgi:hypothetical protein
MRNAALPVAALLAWTGLAAGAIAQPGTPLAIAQKTAKAHHVAHAVFWLKGNKVYAEQWLLPGALGWSLEVANSARKALVGGRKPITVMPFGHGRAGGLVATFRGGLDITYETLLDEITGRYDHVTSILAAPDGQDTLSLDERKDLRKVKQ